MFKKEMKSTIMYAVSQDILSLATKKGYNGAPILSICADSIEKLIPLQQWCGNLGYTSKIISNESDEHNKPKALKSDIEYCLFIVFGEDTFNENYYDLL